MRRMFLAAFVLPMGCFDPDGGVAEGTTDPGTDTTSTTFATSTSASPASGTGTSTSSSDDPSSSEESSTGALADDSSSSSGEAAETGPGDASTGCDTACTGPSVVAVEPDDLASILFTRDPITLTFSESIDPSTVTTSTLRLTRGDQALPGEVEAAGTTAVFTPREPWALAGRYTLRVSSGISSAAGEPLVASSHTLMFPDGDWSTELLDERTVVPAIAVSRSGEHGALAVALSGDDPPEMFVARFSLEEGWSDLEALTSNSAGPYPSSPSIDVNDAGEIAAVWQNYDGIDEASYIPGTGWSDTQFIDGSGYQPVVFLANDGAANCVFRANHETWQITRSSYRIPRVGSTTTVLSDRLLDANGLTAAASEANGLVVGWIQEDRVWALRTGGTATPLSRADVVAATPRVAIDAGRGTAVAVWIEPGADAPEIWAARSVSETTWGSATRLSDGTAVTSEPTVAIDSLGHAIVLWRQLEGSNTHLYAARYVVGAGWTEGAPISAGSTEEVAGPALVLDPGGHGYAMWRQATVSGDPLNELWGARFLAEEGWEAPRRIYEGDATVTAPVLDIDDVGRVVAGFGGDGLWVARFE